MAWSEQDIMDELFRRNQEAERLFRRRNAWLSEMKSTDQAAHYESRCFAQLFEKDNFMFANASTVMRFCDEQAQRYEPNRCVVCNHRICIDKSTHFWHLHVFKRVVFGRPGNPGNHCSLCNYGIPLKAEFMF